MPFATKPSGTTLPPLGASMELWHNPPLSARRWLQSRGWGRRVIGERKVFMVVAIDGAALCAA